MPRTDHSEIIETLRESAEERRSRSRDATLLLCSGWGIVLDPSTAAKAEVAVADLLELHDATGLNLHQAPGLLAFVEAFIECSIGAYGVKVQDNGA